MLNIVLLLTKVWKIRNVSNYAVLVEMYRKCVVFFSMWCYVARRYEEWNGISMMKLQVKEVRGREDHEDNGMAIYGTTLERGT